MARFSVWATFRTISNKLIAWPGVLNRSFQSGLADRYFAASRNRSLTSLASGSDWGNSTGQIKADDLDRRVALAGAVNISEPSLVEGATLCKEFP